MPVRQLGMRYVEKPAINILFELGMPEKIRANHPTPGTDCWFYFKRTSELVTDPDVFELLIQVRGGEMVGTAYGRRR
jgi:hypothetical protein